LEKENVAITETPDLIVDKPYVGMPGFTADEPVVEEAEIVEETVVAPMPPAPMPVVVAQVPVAPILVAEPIAPAPVQVAPEPKPQETYSILGSELISSDPLQYRYVIVSTKYLGDVGSTYAA